MSEAKKAPKRRIWLDLDGDTEVSVLSKTQSLVRMKNGKTNVSVANGIPMPVIGTPYFELKPPPKPPPFMMPSVFVGTDKPKAPAAPAAKDPVEAPSPNQSELQLPGGAE